VTDAHRLAAQIGNVFACRTDRESIVRVGFWTNRLVLVGSIVEVAVILGLITIPPLRHVVGLAPLAVREWGVLLAFPVVVLLLEEARKAVVRPWAGNPGVKAVSA
jgi:Ca2+-transporting ATPase